MKTGTPSWADRTEQLPILHAGDDVYGEYRGRDPEAGDDCDFAVALAEDAVVQRAEGEDSRASQFGPTYRGRVAVAPLEAQHRSDHRAHHDGQFGKGSDARVFRALGNFDLPCLVATTVRAPPYPPVLTDGASALLVQFGMSRSRRVTGSATGCGIRCG